MGGDVLHYIDACDRKLILIHAPWNLIGYIQNMT